MAMLLAKKKKYGSYSSPHNFHLIISPITMTEQKGKWYHLMEMENGNGIRSTEALEHENTRKDVTSCDYWEKWRTIFQATAKYAKKPKGHF